MTAPRWLAGILAALFALSSASAAPSYVADAISVHGTSVVTGDIAALFFDTMSEGASFTITAPSATIERTWYLYATDGLGQVGFGHNAQPERETIPLGEITIESVAARSAGALLLLAERDPLGFEGVVSGMIDVDDTTDPRFDEGGPSTVDAGPGERADFAVHESLPGVFLNVTPELGTFEIRGAFSLRVFEADYVVDSAGERRVMRTGFVYEVDSAAAKVGRIEQNILRFDDAVITMTLPTTAFIMATHPVVDFQGSLVAKGGRGTLEVPTLFPESPGVWSGAGSLDLVPDAEGILITPPSTVVAASSAPQVARTPPVVAYALGVLALASVAALGAVLIHRRRASRGDDLELALLAMEERRWTDALPHLERLVVKQPNDAAILMDRAICLEESGRLPEARAGYEETLRVEPHNAEAHYYYARTLARLRMGTAALAHLSRALVLDERLAELARGENAFSAFRDHPQFRSLVR